MVSSRLQIFKAKSGFVIRVTMAALAIFVLSILNLAIAIEASFDFLARYAHRTFLVGSPISRARLLCELTTGMPSPAITEKGGAPRTPENRSR